MAIKIKKKSNDPDGEIRDVEAYGTPELVDHHEDIDVVIPQFVSKKRTFLEEPKSLAIIGLGAIVISLGGYYGFQYLQKQRVDQSTVLNDAFNASWKLTAAEAEGLTQRENPIQLETYEDASKRAEAVLAAAAAAESKASGDLRVPALMLKAGASLELGKYDDAIAAYSDVLKSSLTPYELVPVRQGLSDAYAAKGEWDKAIEQLDAMAAVDAKLAKSMKYRKGLLLEKSGKIKEAKEIYHEIVESEPETAYKSDIERRLATL